MITDEEYVYELIADENTARICAELISDEFAAREPTTSFASFPSKQLFEETTWPSMMEALKQQLSFFARHRSSGKIVGALMANDLYVEHEKYPYDASSPAASLPVIDLLDEMTDRFIHRDLDKELKPNMVLHIWMGATLVDHASKGVGTRLRVITCDHARNTRGFQYALVQATNPATRQIYLKKMNGKIVSELDATTWIWKKKNDGTSCPYKEFKGAPIPNILINLAQNNN